MWGVGNLKKKRGNIGFHGFILLESSISLGVLCLVMLSLLPIIVQMKEQTAKWQRRTDAARLGYESSQQLMKEDNVHTTITNDGRQYHIQASIGSHEKGRIMIETHSPVEKWLIYEK